MTPEEEAIRMDESRAVARMRSRKEGGRALVEGGGKVVVVDGGLRNFSAGCENGSAVLRF
jgi:hypothetical protein